MLLKLSSQYKHSSQYRDDWCWSGESLSATAATERSGRPRPGVISGARVQLLELGDRGHQHHENGAWGRFSLHVMSRTVEEALIYQARF